MPVILPPTPKKKAAIIREQVDCLSLDDDCSIQMALQSVFDAAVALDSFLANNNDEKESTTLEKDQDDDSSFASEVCRLQASEVALREALEFVDSTAFVVGDKDTSPITPLKRHQHLPSLDCCSDGSFDSPESQVPFLQPVSPLDSPVSECGHSSSPSPMDKTNYSKQQQVIPSSPTSPSVIHLTPTKKRQIRPYGLCREEDKSFVDLEAPSCSSSLKTVNDATALSHVANALFGRSEYTVQPFFSKEMYTRTRQGTVSVYLSTLIAAVSSREPSLQLLLILVIPAFIAVLLAHLPHRIDESLLAIVMLGTHAITSHLYHAT